MLHVAFSFVKSEIIILGQYEKNPAEFMFGRVCPLSCPFKSTSVINNINTTDKDDETTRTTTTKTNNNIMRNDIFQKNPQQQQQTTTTDL